MIAQNLIVIDSANHQYRKDLEVLYNQKISQSIASFQSIKDKKIKKEVIHSYNEFNSEFLDKIKSGVFVNEYIFSRKFSEILNKLIHSNPNLPEIAKTNILLSFDSKPNAYAIGDDFVIVTIPLLKNIKNEYELAFIISHEIAHNILTHSKNQLLNHAKTTHSEQIKKETQSINKKKYNKGEYASRMFREIIYGKRKNNRFFEEQADSLGFLIFRNAFKEHEHHAIKSLETLDEIDKERDSLSLADYIKLFSTEKNHFKEEWLNNDEISHYKYDENPKYWVSDSLKTHPDCKIRAKLVKDNFKITDNYNDSELLKSDFDLIKKTSMYNHVLGLYVLEEFGRSLYEALLLLKHEPENMFLNNLVYNNLIKLQEAQKSYTLNKYLENVNPKNSNSYNTYLSFIRQLRKSEFNEIINHYYIKL